MADDPGTPKPSEKEANPGTPTKPSDRETTAGTPKPSDRETTAGTPKPSEKETNPGTSKPSDEALLPPLEAKLSTEAQTAFELEKMSGIERRRPSELVRKEGRRRSDVEGKKKSELEGRKKSELEGRKKSELMKREPREKKTSAVKPSANSLKNLNMFQKAMSDRNQAKKEENDYVNLRKQQLLADLLPKTKGAKIRRSDEKFPSHQLKAMEKDNFGAIKAKYMAMRPNGKYATWFGKNQDEKHKHEKCVPIKERMYMTMNIDPKQEIKPEPPPNALPSAPPSNIAAREGCQKAVSDDPEAEEMEHAVDDDDEVEDDLMTNARYSRPLNDRGIPFWLEEAENDNTTDDEETIVSREAVEKDGPEALTKIKEDPRGGAEFNSSADLKDLSKHDKLFGQHMVYLGTIMNVVNLWGQAPDEKENPLPPKTERTVKFTANMTVSEYAPGIDNITAKKGVSTVTKELKDVVKVADRE